MSNDAYLIRGAALTDVADALRFNRYGSSDAFTPAQMAQAAAVPCPVNLIPSGRLVDRSDATVVTGSWFTVDYPTDILLPSGYTWPRGIRWTCVRDVPDGTDLRILYNNSATQAVTWQQPVDTISFVWRLYNQSAANTLKSRLQYKIRADATVYTSSVYTLQPGTLANYEDGMYWTSGSSGAIAPCYELHVIGPIAAGDAFTLLGLGAYGTSLRDARDLCEIAAYQAQHQTTEEPAYALIQRGNAAGLADGSARFDGRLDVQ